MNRVARLKRRTLAGLWAVLMSLCAPVLAHEMTMMELTMREYQPGQFTWGWGPSGKSRPVSEDLTPVWPQGCQASEQVVQCGPKGLYGPFTIEGVGKAYSAAVVRIFWREGPPQVFTLTGGQPKVQLFGGAKDTRGATEVGVTYGLLGFEHILTGYDHLLFVISLLMLVGFNRRLVVTITAFTIAHSLTLAASALGWLVLRSPPVEATIALSIVLVCGEALRRDETLTRRWPALVAFAFGLIHGLGFAGALKEIGLPQEQMLVALLSFNLGVEAGQIAVVLVAWLVWLAASRIGLASRLRVPVLYAVGAVGAFWVIDRLVTMGLGA